MLDVDPVELQAVDLMIGLGHVAKPIREIGR
jgi:hypothetical protein